MLPDLKSPSLKLVLLLLIGGCGVMFVSAVRMAVSGHLVPLVVSLLLWLPLAWGLWWLHPVARKVAVTLLWVTVIVMPIGLINPFAAMDGVVDPHTSIWSLATPIYGLVAVALLCLHILGKYKEAFSHGG